MQVVCDTPLTGPPHTGDGLDFTRLMDAMPAAAYSTDADGLITHFNRRAAAVWGREPRRYDPLDRY